MGSIDGEMILDGHHERRETWSVMQGILIAFDPFFDSRLEERKSWIFRYCPLLLARADEVIE